MMSESSFSMMIRNLCDEYYHHNISLEEYQEQRKILLNKIDREFNGANINETAQLPFMGTVTFLNNEDITKRR